MPISYSPRSGQHHHHLRTYKQQPPSRQAQWNLLALLLLFLREHLDHIATRVRAHPTHVVTVPSTRGRPGTHPLTRLLGDRLGLPWITAVADQRHGPEARDLHRGWFTVTGLTTADPIHALIIEDTWTTGARAPPNTIPPGGNPVQPRPWQPDLRISWHRFHAFGAVQDVPVLLAKLADPDPDPATARRNLHALWNLPCHQGAGCSA